MQNIRIAHLAKCPICGGSAKLRKNAAKRFQVACSKCRFRTAWERKCDAIISWYNMSEVVRKKKEENPEWRTSVR